MTIDDQATPPATDPVSSSPRSRRALLAGAVGSVAAVIAAHLGRPESASAAAGDPLILGNTANNAGTANTTMATMSSGTALLVTQNGTGTAVRGSAVGPNSIAGFFTATNGPGVSGVTGRNTTYGVYAANDAPTRGVGAAVRAAGQQNHGLVATTSNNEADAVQAVQAGPGTAIRATAPVGVAMQAVGQSGVSAEATGTNANGVYGLASASGPGTGVRGETFSGAGRGVYGLANVGDTNDVPVGVLGETQTPGGIAVQGTATAGGTGVRGDSAAFIGVRGTGVTGVHGIGAEVGVFGQSNDPSAPTDGVKGSSASSAGTGVHGIADSATGAAVGVLGDAVSSAGTGVKGIASRAFGSTVGVHGEVASPAGVGVKGAASAASGSTTGVHGEVASPSGVGVRGMHSSSVGTGFGVVGSTNSPSGVGVRGDATSPTGNTAAIYGQNVSTGGMAIFGRATSPTGQVTGVLGQTQSTAEIASGVWGTAIATTGKAAGVYGTTQSTEDSAGVLGWALAITGTAAGVQGIASSADGVGVSGIAISSPTIGVLGSGSGSGYGIFSDGPAKVVGDLDVTGSISKGGGGFKIDHPLDPANRFLSHSFVESPDMKNIYDGVVELDGKGEATIELPDYFEALNRDIRYQLTPIGEYAPLFVRSKVQSGRFSIAGGAAGQEVSWQVTGIRKDAWAEAHRIPGEEDKKGNVKGRYLHPEEHGQKASKGIKLPKAAQRAIAKAPELPKAPKLPS